MRKIISSIWGVALVVTLMSMMGCSDHSDELFSKTVDNLEEEVSTLLLQLPGEVNSRLSYEEVDGKSIKTYWKEGDQLVANATPNDEYYAYVYKLIDGAGTRSGTFECNEFPHGQNPEYLSSNAWTLYYPGSKIQGEQDYFNFSYVGQVQKGNSNYDHIGDYHSMRLLCVDIESSSAFFNEMIDFSKAEVDQSACMKFNLSGFENAIVPKKIELMYADPDGNFKSCFHTYNYLDSHWTGVKLNGETTLALSLGLENIEATQTVTAYMMMSNYPVILQQNGKFRVYVTDADGNRYYCDKTIAADTSLEGGKMYRITCKSWTQEKVSGYDGMNNPVGNIVLLQEATQGTGTDIVIMGDGFSETHFTEGNYKDIMRQAYENFFSVEPYQSLKEYFNVYYINAVSQEEHDAVPHSSGNGATNGDAVTIFNTQFTQGDTKISGNDDLVMYYAKQAIRYKGGKGGVECTDSEAQSRANSALCIVMVNVATHAGTCSLYWYSSPLLDHNPAHSIAYTSLNPDEEIRRLTTVHEAGGHGFGKLGDEYGGRFITKFNTAPWTNLSNQHSYGVYRNVNEYWGENERQDGWSFTWTDTTSDNVYWSELLSPEYSYISNEGLGIYRGAFTYDNLYCRSTDNSLMHSQFEANGQSFNAISRWAIWYRLMRLTGGTTATQFKESLDEFVAWDSTIDGWIPTTTYSIRNFAEDNGLLPLAPPVLIECRLENGRLVEIK